MSKTKVITLHGLKNGRPVSVKLNVDDGCKLFLNSSGGDLSVSDIPKNLIWKLDILESNDLTFVYDHVGGRPKDRK